MKKNISLIIGFILGLMIAPGLLAQDTELSNKGLMTPWAADLNPEEVLPEYPRPQLIRDEWLNLNGWWQYESATSLERPPIGRDLSDKILVPFCVESILSGIQRADTIMWYRRTFSIPENWNDQLIHLHFGAVDWEAKIYLNGKYIGNHKGGHDEFSFEISSSIIKGENELIVGVEDMTSPGIAHGKQNRVPNRWTYTSATGIWQTVWLEPTPKTYISGIELVPDLETSNLKIRLQIVGGDAYGIKASAFSESQLISSINGNPGNTLLLNIKDPRLWSPDDPFLYDLSIELTNKNKEIIDAIESYFGMRSIEMGYVNGVVRPLLNGKFVYQTGTLDQGYWPDGLYTAVTDEALKYDIQIHKDMGFNMVRKHVKVEPQRWYYWCDKLGLLVWQDMPHKRQIDPESNTQWEVELKEMILEHINSPSIVYWVVFNELWGIYDTDRITEYARKLDPSRLIGAQSGGEDLRGFIDTGAGDGRDHHDYHENPASQVPNPEETPNPFRISAVGEYGGIECVVPGYSYGESSSRKQNRIEDVTGIYIGMQEKLLPWISKRLSAAVYTQIVDVETEQNGLYTYDRKLSKVDLERIRNINLKLIREGELQNQ
jgi:beta-galactosidase/beta-glucuronidase